jgi:hypothetical protein
MNKFLMICYVAADFYSGNGEKFRITPANIGVFVEAPEWVKDTLLFKLLVKDGSVRVAEGKAEQKALENDPMKEIAADGKKIEEQNEEETPEVPETKVIKTRKATAKKKG